MFLIREEAEAHLLTAEPKPQRTYRSPYDHPQPSEKDLCEPRKKDLRKRGSIPPPFWLIDRGAGKEPLGKELLI